jgi:hypothetical protein
VRWRKLLASYFQVIFSTHVYQIICLPRFHQPSLAKLTSA